MLGVKASVRGTSREDRFAVFLVFEYIPRGRGNGRKIEVG